eukprot:523847-Prymnesium_polylepis.1
MAAAGSAYIIFFSSKQETQARAGFDGWVMLLRDDMGFDTEDQAWPKERERLSAIAEQKLDALRLGGIDNEALELTYTAHLLLEAPDYDLEEERLWCIEFFTQKIYDYVVRAAVHRTRCGRQPTTAQIESAAGNCPPPGSRAGGRQIATAGKQKVTRAAGPGSPEPASGIVTMGSVGLRHCAVAVGANRHCARPMPSCVGSGAGIGGVGVAHVSRVLDRV